MSTAKNDQHFLAVIDNVVAMYVSAVPNRGSKPTILLRESYREDGKVKNRTLANLTKLPPHAVEALRRLLKGEALVSADEAFDIESSVNHGHVEAVLMAMKGKPDVRWTEGGIREALLRSFPEEAGREGRHLDTLAGKGVVRRGEAGAILPSGAAIDFWKRQRKFARNLLAR